MSEGRSGDCTYCPNCGNWRFVETVKNLPNEQEGDRIVFKRKCKCTACKHKWIEVTKWN
jgi:hypothetical protein